ncbi:hypothetical protein KUF54_06135 [Comamonas sp. Y33R10-2]|uniref:hypothetical protein n=1 Tax=Comamonas sp. Y33R10-2 TaxID=2853257 RepID=UPI001C5CA195|nr:hypothetical protein [Comamonas sp. Y33R10-2]QXZ10782.1 hypothetical protein KUF54_06135 [Comamonas sp. Y33R10-2]
MYQITAPKKYTKLDIVFGKNNVTRYFIHPSMINAQRVKQRFSDAVIAPDLRKTEEARIAWIAYTAWALAKQVADGRIYRDDPLIAAEFMARCASMSMREKPCPFTRLDFEMMLFDAFYRKRRPFAIG